VDEHTPPSSPPPFRPGEGPPPPAEANGPAIASLVCGLLGCIPVVTGLAAVVLGILGIRKASDPRVGGRGMAIVGLILGLVSLAVWLFLGMSLATGFYFLAQATAPAADVAERFTRALSTGDVDGALAESVPGTDRAALAAQAERMKDWGPLKSIGRSAVDLRVTNGKARVELKGVAVFEKTSRPYAMTLVQDPGGDKVSEFRFD
jgi:hypothetical protein